MVEFNNKTISDNKRIARNTLLLYFRMILILFVGLYTSRVVLQTLGIEDYGIYSVVAGFLSMFSILTGALSTAIMRYITVEIAKKDIQRLKKVFATSLTVQLIMGIIVIVLIETIGIWALNNKLVIPNDRNIAAQFCLHCTAFSIFMSLLYVPFNSLIIAYEKMSAFAYVSILEVCLKLGMCFALYITPFDKLKTYAFSMCIVAVSIQLVYWIYCKSNCLGCNIKIIFEKKLFFDIWKFAGWNMLGNGAGILNSQGVNMLMNMFFGVCVNAARGISDQVNNVVLLFVNNFMMALNPQITKSYAIKDFSTSYKLACKGARFSFYIMYALALPILLESEFILNLWLGTPPDLASNFIIWTILSSLTIVLGNTLITLQLAQGEIKKYQLIMATVGCLPFPLSWFAFKLGANVEVSYIIYFINYWLLIFIRFVIVNKSTGLPKKMYLNDVVLNCHVTALLASIAPLIIHLTLSSGLLRFLIVTLTSFICLFLTIYIYSINTNERNFINKFCIKIFNKIFTL